MELGPHEIRLLDFTLCTDFASQTTPGVDRSSTTLRNELKSTPDANQISPIKTGKDTSFFKRHQRSATFYLLNSWTPIFQKKQ